MGETGIREIFLEEAREIINSLESDIVQFEEKPDDTEIINQIFRNVHTLKGSSGIAGFSDISDFTHKLENLLDKVRKNELSVDDSLIDLILNCVDWLKEEIFSTHEDSGESQSIHDALITRINTYKSDESESKEIDKEGPVKQKGGTEFDSLLSVGGEEKFIKVHARFKEDIFESGIDPLMLIEDLLSTGDLVYKKVDKKALPEFPDITPEKCYLEWEIIIKTSKGMEAVQDVFLFVLDDNDISFQDVTVEFKEIESGRFF